VAKGRGSASDKAKAAAEALKDPGAPGSGEELRRKQQGERAGGERGN
jgi:hypothetical protein